MKTIKRQSETKEEKKFREEFPLKTETETLRRFNRVQQGASIEEKIDRLLNECGGCETDEEETSLLIACQKAWKKNRIRSDGTGEVFGG